MSLVSWLGRAAVLAVGTLALAAAPQGLGAQLAPGWSYMTNITIDSGTAGRKVSMAMRQQVTDRNFRTQLVQMSGVNNGADASEGTYIIYDTVDSTMTMVTPSRQTATIMGLGSVMAIVPHTKLTLRASNSGAYEDIGDGGPKLGHPTRHYRSTTVGSMEFAIDGQTCSKPMNSVSDVWIAADVDLQPAIRAVMLHFGPAADPAGVDPLGSENSTPMPKGTPLRTVTTTTATDATGAEHTVTTTAEYVEITHGPIDQSVFKAPTDYQVMDMRQMMAAMPAGMMDSVTRAGSQQMLAKLCH